MFGRLWDSIVYSMGILRNFLPVILIVGGGYLLYIRSVRNDFQMTITDVKNINESMFVNMNGPKSGLSIDTAVFAGVIPMDMKREQFSDGYKVYHRFGGELKLTESFATTEERTLYLALQNNKERYNQISKGLGAYMMTFLNLSRSQCKLMAMNNWRNVYSNYLGMEVARINPKSNFIGTYNLNHYVLFNNKDEKFDTKDTGVITRTYLNEQQATKACNCLVDECMVTLKFY